MEVRSAPGPAITRAGGILTMKMTFVAAAATAVLTTAPLATPTKAQDPQGVDVQIGRDRPDRLIWPPSTPGVVVAALGNPLWDPNWLLGGGFRRSRCCWLGYHNRIGNRLRNIDRFRAGLMSTNHARSP
jgi:hypothetical protein